MRAEIEGAAFFGERAAVDQFGARLGERAFAKCGKFFVKFAREDELQHGVAEKFEPLIVLDGHALLVGNGGMRQRQPQQTGIAESVAQAGLEFLKFGHGFGKGDDVAGQSSKHQALGEAPRTDIEGAIGE